MCSNNYITFYSVSLSCLKLRLCIGWSPSMMWDKPLHSMPDDGDVKVDQLCCIATAHWRPWQLVPCFTRCYRGFDSLHLVRRSGDRIRWIALSAPWAGQRMCWIALVWLLVVFYLLHLNVFLWVRVLYKEWKSSLHPPFSSSSTHISLYIHWRNSTTTLQQSHIKPPQPPPCSSPRLSSPLSSQLPMSLLLLLLPRSPWWPMFPVDNWEPQADVRYCQHFMHLDICCRHPSRYRHILHIRCQGGQDCLPGHWRPCHLRTLHDHIQLERPIWPWQWLYHFCRDRCGQEAHCLARLHR